MKRASGRCGYVATRPTCNRVDHHYDARAPPPSARGFPFRDEMKQHPRLERCCEPMKDARFPGDNARWRENSWSGNQWNSRRQSGAPDRGYWNAERFGISDQRSREGVCFRGGYNNNYRAPGYSRWEPPQRRNQNYFGGKPEFRLTPQSSSSSTESNDGEFGKPRPHPLSRRGSPIYPLRTFNNWAKVKIIQQAVPDDLTEPLVVVDLGCSKGVDLKKWAHSKVKHVYLVDDDEEDMHECQRRFIEIDRRWPNKFKASFINKDFAYDDIKLPEKVDLVSCQFLVHRAFCSEEEATTFAKNVSRALKDGGNLIISLVNADKIKKLLFKSPNRKTYSNGVFTVELESPLSDNCPEFGIKMIFRVDDKFFPENLVQLKTLQRILKKENLELIWQRSFPELYEEARGNEEQKTLLATMGVVEDSRLLMSRPELETADLYEAVMFKKLEAKEPVISTIKSVVTLEEPESSSQTKVVQTSTVVESGDVDVEMNNEELNEENGEYIEQEDTDHKMEE